MGTSIQAMLLEKGEVHLMHALGMGAMLKREAVVVVTGQPGFQPEMGQTGLGYNQHGYGQPGFQPGMGQTGLGYNQHGYGQPVTLDGFARPSYGIPSPGQPGFGIPSASSVPYHATTDDGAPPPSYNEAKEKF